MTDQRQQTHQNNTVEEILGEYASWFPWEPGSLKKSTHDLALKEATQAINNLIEAERLRARIKELEWSAYARGDLFMERVGIADVDAHTEVVERDRRTHHDIVAGRIATLKTELDNLEKDL